ncbi:hypothetical protein Ciccas_008798 [Cichlidogyrus casuarinus]|uniref:HMA domain-containing protein n=1 Tax=Cichlidogyrus casuarinus TaxID=1844966 RepID=A0ABD2Q0J3_9PLAT
MTCESCVETIESHLRKIAGIVEVTVTLKEGGSCNLVYNSQLISARSIIDSINDLGFHAQLWPNRSSVSASHSSDLLKFVTFSNNLSMPSSLL